MEFDDSLSASMDDFAENTQDLDIPEELPMMAVRDVVVFNYMIIPLFVGRSGSISAVNDAMSGDKLLMLVTQKDATKDDPDPEDVYQVGMVSMIMRSLKLPDGRLKVLVQALSKAQIRAYRQKDPHFRVEIDLLEEQETEVITVETEALMRTVREQTEKIMSLRGILSADLMMIINNIEEPGRLADLVGSNLRLKISESQQILETTDPVERLRLVADLLNKELEVSTVQAKIQSDAKEEMSRSQREYYLREQMQALKKELGDEDAYGAELDGLRKKIKKKKMPKYARKEARKELKRLDMMHPDASEANIIRTYIEWILDLPWSKKSRDRKDLSFARQVLDEDHYGLEDVKERIIEFLAVRKMASKTMKAPIICLVGPPGVGKTSIARSVARSLNRKFVRMSLGGVRDEAEIRGHRRTYVGALPGNIITNMKKVGVVNPVFLFDEIDKLASDFRGDPASALLEVLDPEQNNTFTDHFMELPYDLSNVMFITTANTAATIPGPLRDRMEIIEISSYTENEKYEIAKRYLVPKQLDQHGLKESQLKFSPAALKEVISGYTREAGVRNLERQIANICRKVVTILQEDPKAFTDMHVNKSNLTRFLGPERFMYDKLEKEDQIGLATGLAWTSVGGVTLFIEVSVMPGKGKVQLTGKLGDVMKESALTGMSYIRTIADSISLEPDFHEKYDVHIHIPEGATPKDGPSAGITMVTAVTSALCKRPVRSDIAMTGEVTLRGRVLPIGGLKEKTLAAHRAGIRTLIIPFDNKKDVEKIPEKVREQMKFIFVKSMDEVLKHALV